MLKIGVMGCAAIARRRTIPAILKSGVFELSAVASRRLKQAEVFTSEFGGEALGSYDAILERHDLDALYIPLPTGLHEEWVKAALEAGFHVLVEKSFTDRVEPARRLTELARERRLLLMENFMFLYHLQLQRILELLRDGAVGEIRTLRSSFGFPPLDRSNFRYDSALGGGALIDAGTYTLRAARFFLEDAGDLEAGEGLRVLGASLHYEDSGSDGRKRGVDLYGAAMLENARGVPAQVAFGFDHFYQCSVELWGSRGKLIAERAFTAHPGFSPRLTLQRDSGQEQFELEPDDHFTNLLREFARCIHDGDHARHRTDLIEQARLLEEVRRTAETQT